VGGSLCDLGHIQCLHSARLGMIAVLDRYMSFPSGQVRLLEGIPYIYTFIHLYISIQHVHFSRLLLSPWWMCPIDSIDLYSRALYLPTLLVCLPTLFVFSLHFLMLPLFCFTLQLVKFMQIFLNRLNNKQHHIRKNQTRENKHKHKEGRGSDPRIRCWEEYATPLT
jgi:hypothetical protein